MIGEMLVLMFGLWRAGDAPKPIPPAPFPQGKGEETKAQARTSFVVPAVLCPCILPLPSREGGRGDRFLALGGLSFARFQPEDGPPAGVRVPVVRPAEQFWNAAGTGLEARWSVEPAAAPLGRTRTLRLTLGPLDNPADIVAPDLASMSAFSKAFRLGKPSIGPGAMPSERIISWPLTPLRPEANAVPALPYRYFDPRRRVPEDRWQLRFPTTQVESIPLTILPDVVAPPPRSPLILSALASELVGVEERKDFRVRGWMWGIGPLVVGIVAGYRRWTGSHRRAALVADRHTRRVLRRLRREKLDAAEVREVVLAWCERHYLASRQHLPGEVRHLVGVVDRGTFSPHSAADVGEAVAEIERLVLSGPLSAGGAARSAWPRSR